MDLLASRTDLASDPPSFEASATGREAVPRVVERRATRYHGPMHQADLTDLQRAKEILERPGLAMRLASMAGTPFEWALRRLPDRARELVASATHAALEKALDLALSTLEKGTVRPPRDWSHRLTVWGTGAAGGLFGLAGLPVELPVTTAVMLRSIADHARAQGEELSSLPARMACLEVFALGSAARSDDAAESGYFATRALLARAVSEAAEYLAGRTGAEVVARKASPAILRLLGIVASRFSVTVEDKLAAQLVPAVGALGGAALNHVFLEHFQRAAWGHFTVRRLERALGAAAVRAAYDALPAAS